MLLAQTEHYVEYSRTGAVIKGQERAKVKSRYEEDVFINNHTVSACVVFFCPHHVHTVCMYMCAVGTYCSSFVLRLLYVVHTVLC